MVIKKCNRLYMRGKVKAAEKTGSGQFVCQLPFF